MNIYQEILELSTSYKLVRSLLLSSLTFYSGPHVPYFHNVYNFGSFKFCINACRPIFINQMIIWILGNVIEKIRIMDAFLGC